MIYRFSIIFLFGAAIMGCSKIKRTTEISGQVLEYGTENPIEGARVLLKDGYDGSGPITNSDYTTDAETEVFTNDIGFFKASLRGAYPTYLYLSKEEEYWPYDFGVNAITNKANIYEKGSKNEDEQIFLKAFAYCDAFLHQHERICRSCSLIII